MGASFLVYGGELVRLDRYRREDAMKQAMGSRRRIPTPRTGQWQVATETSLYVVDLDARLVTRVPDAGAGTRPGLSPVAIASLRRDYEPVTLIELIECQLDRPSAHAA